MQPPIFHHPTYAVVFYAVFLIWLVPEVVRSWRRVPNMQVTGQDRGSKLVMIASIWIGIVAAYWLAGLVTSTTISWHQPLVFSFGIVLMVLGLLLRWYAIRSLGRYFTSDVVIQSSQPVVEVGPYRLLRHPAYSGTLVTLLGIGVAFTNWASVVAMLVIPSIGYAYCIHVEEHPLREWLGESYVQYMHRTHRLIPWVY